jgi:ubiquinone/menaquinone biosynthesis C-methylase UbiE
VSHIEKELKMTNWTYNEEKHCGVDYSDEKHANIYDSLHQQFRSYEKEFKDMLEFLGLSNTQEMSVIDLGCGTGASTIFASNKFKTTFAVDVSNAMISKAQKKAVAGNIKNVEFHTGGFLSYEHNSESVDLIIAKHSFHHLPDFWKQIALFRMNKMIKNNGVFYLCDVVFNLESSDYKTKIDNWVAGFEELAGTELSTEVQTHIRDEFSTFDWILEAMFGKAGFNVEKKRSTDGFITEYLCRKVKEIEFQQ